MPTKEDWYKQFVDETGGVSDTPAASDPVVAPSSSNDGTTNCVVYPGNKRFVNHIARYVLENGSSSTNTTLKSLSDEFNLFHRQVEVAARALPGGRRDTHMQNERVSFMEREDSKQKLWTVLMVDKDTNARAFYDMACKHFDVQNDYA